MNFCKYIHVHSITRVSKKYINMSCQKHCIYWQKSKSMLYGRADKLCSWRDPGDPSVKPFTPTPVVTNMITVVNQQIIRIGCAGFQFKWKLDNRSSGQGWSALFYRIDSIIMCLGGSLLFWMMRAALPSLSSSLAKSSWCQCLKNRRDELQEHRERRFDQ